MFFDAIVNDRNNLRMIEDNMRARHWQTKERIAEQQFNNEQAEIAHERTKELTNMQAELSLQNQLDLERQTPQARIEGLKAAGMNLGMAAGMGGTGSAGVASTSGAQAHGASAPSTTTAHLNPISAGGLGELMDVIGKSQEINNMRAEQEKTEAETDTLRGKTPGAEADIAKKWQDVEQGKQAITESTAKIALMGSETEINNANADFQKIQNEIAKDTKGSQKEIIRRTAKRIKKEYELIGEDIQHRKLENKSYEEYIEALINNYFANANEAIAKAANLDIDTEFQDYTFTARQELLGWQGVNEMEFGERFAEQLAAELRAQNIQISKEVIDALVGIGSTVVRAKAIGNMGKALRRGSTTTIERGVINKGRFTPVKATRKYIKYD